MTPRIETLIEKKLIGKRLKMSLTENKTVDIWKSFMPRCKEITNNVTNDIISMQVYESEYFTNFNPTKEFEKWATIEVSNFENVPTDMETFTLKGGLYAVFDYKGLSTDNRIFNYIFKDWLPNSNFDLDHRPHFEILGDKYKNGDPTSEEEIWIPIQPKK